MIYPSAESYVGDCLAILSASAYEGPAHFSLHNHLLKPRSQREMMEVWREVFAGIVSQSLSSGMPDLERA